MMPGCSTGLLKCFWFSIVGGTIADDWMDDDAQAKMGLELLEMFEKYDVEPLKKKAEDWLCEKVTISNVILVLTKAKLHCAGHLAQYCVEFIRAHRRNPRLSVKVILASTLDDEVKTHLFAMR